MRNPAEAYRKSVAMLVLGIPRATRQETYETASLMWTVLKGCRSCVAVKTAHRYTEQRSACKKLAVGRGEPCA
jgi:hypothetical protein